MASIQPGISRPRLQSQEFGQLDGIDLSHHSFPKVFLTRPKNAIASSGQRDPGIPAKLPFELPGSPTRIIGDDDGGFGSLADDLLDERSLERDENPRDDLMISKAGNGVDARSVTRARGHPDAAVCPTRSPPRRSYQPDP